jgi:hypothetical protein
VILEVIQIIRDTVEWGIYRVSHEVFLIFKTVFLMRCKMKSLIKQQDWASKNIFLLIKYNRGGGDGNEPNKYHLLFERS